jgi:hypothetical protein
VALAILLQPARRKDQTAAQAVLAHQITAREAAVAHLLLVQQELAQPAATVALALHPLLVAAA